MEPLDPILFKKQLIAASFKLTEGDNTEIAFSTEVNIFIRVVREHHRHANALEMLRRDILNATRVY